MTASLDISYYQGNLPWWWRQQVPLKHQ
jgi:hypothetical protein